jgi:Rap1a immunity proteins
VNFQSAEQPAGRAYHLPGCFLLWLWGESMRMALAAVFGLLAISAQADPDFMDGNGLNGRLLRQDPSAMTYIFGVYDAVQITQYHAPSAERIICAPLAVTGTELVDAVQGYIQAEPSMLNYPAAVLVLRAFIWAFPCDKA